MSTLKKVLSFSWTSIFSGLSTFAVRFALLSIFVFLIIVIVRGLNQDGYSMEPFKVPKQLAEAGYSGDVVALMIQDQVLELKELANSQREDSLDLNVDLRPDLSLDVMGVGLSASSMIFHLRDLLGREIYKIGGNITNMEHMLTMNIRMTGFDSRQIEMPYEIGKSREALEKIINEGARYILRNTDPYRLAVVLDRNGDRKGSEELIRQILRERPNDRKWAYHFWGNLKREDGEKEKAYQHYKRAIEEDPKFILPMRAIAWGLYRDKDYVLALEYFEKVLAIDDMQQSMDTGAALCHRELGNIEKATEYYEANIRKYPQVIWAYGNYSDFLLNIKQDTIKATEIWQQASQSIEESGDYYLAVAAFHSMKNDTTKAMAMAERALELEPDNIGTLSQMVRYYYYQIRDYKKSEFYSKKLIASTKNHEIDVDFRSSNYNMLALAEYQQEKFDSSIVHANVAISIMPENPFPWSTLAEAYLLMGNINEFYRAIEKAVKLGFELEDYLTQHPYKLIADQSRMRRIISTYRKDYVLKG